MLEAERRSYSCFRKGEFCLECWRLNVAVTIALEKGEFLL